MLIGIVAAATLLAAGHWGVPWLYSVSPALAAASQREETPEVLPPGEARDDTFYRCTACHDTAVIRRSALSRGQWDELMDWMTEKHAMPPLEGAEREAIVDYLARAFPPRGGRAARNPFAAD